MVTTRAIKELRAEKIKELARPLKHNADKFYNAHLIAKANKQAETTAEREKLNAHHMDVLGWIALHLRNVFSYMPGYELYSQQDADEPKLIGKHINLMISPHPANKRKPKYFDRAAPRDAAEAETTTESE